MPREIKIGKTYDRVPTCAGCTVSWHSPKMATSPHGLHDSMTAPSEQQTILGHRTNREGVKVQLQLYWENVSSSQVNKRTQA